MEQIRQKEKCYEILLQHEVNENRLLSERIALFFVANSVIFMGFILLIPISKILCSLMFLLGVAICAMSYAGISASIGSLRYWTKAQEQIEKEEEGCFAYMRQKKISPQIHGRKVWEKSKLQRLWGLFPHFVWFFLFVWIIGVLHVWSLF